MTVRPSPINRGAKPVAGAGTQGPTPGPPDVEGAGRDVRRVTRQPGPAEANPRRWLRQQRWLERGLAISAPVALLLIWQICADQGVIDERFFGSPSAVVTDGIALIRDGELQRHLLTSTVRVLIGYAAGATAGLAAGLLLGYSRLLRATFEPLLNALYVVPKLAVLPILLLAFGIGELPKVVLIAIAVFFIVALSSLSAALLTPKGFIEVAESFNASRWRVFRQVILPNALPQVFAALRLASGMAVLMLVGVEFVNAQTGLGYLIWHSWSLFLAGQMYVGIVTVAVFGVVFSSLVKWIGQLVVPWAPRGDARDEVV
jgi:sulfonate transport system permease protein